MLMTSLSVTWVPKRGTSSIYSAVQLKLCCSWLFLFCKLLEQYLHMVLL